MQKVKTSGLRVGIYARRTVDSEKSDSIQMQIEMCKKHLEIARPGQIASVEVFIDEGFTRRNTDRPDWQRMMRWIEDDLLDLVISYKIDRISGNMKDFAIFYSTVVDEYEKQLIAVREHVDSTVPLVGEAMAYICAMMASYEVKQDSIRSYDNSRNLAVHGFWFGGKAPVGYTLSPITILGKTHKFLEVVPEDVAYKQELIDIYLEHGFTLSAMERYLKNSGIQTRQGKFFSAAQIYQLLTAPQCVANTPEIYDYFAAMGCQMEQTCSPREKWDGEHGILIFGRTTEQKGKHVLQNPTEWLVCIGRHKPIVSAETYLRIRAQLTGNTFTKTSTHPPELLKGIVRCKCGRLMRVAYKKRQGGRYSRWYYCLRRMHQGVEYCDMGHTKTDVLNDKVLAIFHGIQTNPSVIDEYLMKEEKKTSKYSLASLQKRERDLETRIQRLASTLALNSDSSAAKYVIEEMERLDEDLMKCRRDISIASAESRRLAAEKKDLESKRARICGLLQDFDSFSMEEQNKIAKEILKECTWDGNVLKIII